MKNINRILLLFFTVLIVQPLTAWSEIAVSESVAPRLKNLFVLKMDKKMVGGKVEILFANGDLVTAQTLKKRKMIIDFRDVKFGAYTIRVSKDGEVEEFIYEKK